MTGELLINGKDAFDILGTSIGEGFFDALLAPAPKKEYITNSSRLKDGKSITGNAKYDERSVTLVFDIEGSNTSDYLNKLKLFYTELGTAPMLLKVPPLGSDIYKLYYQSSSGFALNAAKTHSKVTVKFTEPNPTDRE